MNSWNFFTIGLASLNLFSFMLGVTWAFFQQYVFGKSIGKVIFLYFAILAAWYGGLYYYEINKAQVPVEAQEIIEEIKPR